MDIEDLEGEENIADHISSLLEKYYQVSLVWFGFYAGKCEKERLKVQYTAHRTNSMTGNLTVCLTHP